MHQKIYNKTCATSEGSDQPVHLHSLIRVFADCMCLLEPSRYPKRNKQKSLLYWLDVQADLNLCWLHRSYCRFCCALTHLSKTSNSQPQASFLHNFRQKEYIDKHFFSDFFMKMYILVVISSTSARYNKTSMARTSLGPWKFIRDMGSLSH